MLLYRVLAFLCPPLAVALVEGFSMHVMWTLFYTLCLWLPGVAEAWMAVSGAAVAAEGRRIFARTGRKKVLFVGRGAISVGMGYLLSRAGHHVDYLVRPKHLTIMKDAVDVDIMDCRASAIGVHRQERMATSLVTDLPFGHDYDFIVLAVQPYMIKQAVAQLAPRLGSHAMVISFNNLWDEPEEALAGIPPSQLTWGFASTPGGFPNDPNTFVGSAFNFVVFGTLGTDPSPREIEAREVFRTAGLSVNEERDFRGWVLAHFVVGAALLSESLNAGDNTALSRSVYHLSGMPRNINEFLPLLRARGVDPETQALQLGIARLPPLLVGCILRTTMRLQRFSRSLSAQSNPIDAQMHCVPLLASGKKYGIELPRLTATVARARAAGKSFDVPV